MTTKNGRVALQEELSGQEAIPADPNAKKVAKPGDSRPATQDDIFALRLIDANESVLTLRAQTVDQAKLLAEKERIIATLQEHIGRLERDKYVREIIGLRERFGYVPNQTVLQEDLKGGKFIVSEMGEPEESEKDKKNT